MHSCLESGLWITTMVFAFLHGPNFVTYGVTALSVKLQRCSKHLVQTLLQFVETACLAASDCRDWQIAWVQQLLIPELARRKDITRHRMMHIGRFGITAQRAGVDCSVI